MKKVLLSFLLLLLPIVAIAGEYVYNGVTFKLNDEDKTAEVASYSPDHDFSLGVQIPSAISFYENNELKWYKVTSIGRRAFFGCSSLTDLILSPNIISIGDNAFGYCRNLHSMSIAYGGDIQLTSIGDCAFQGCSALTSITMPNSVTSIGGLAFSGCSGLTSVTIPNNVTYIGSGAFESCSSLSTLTIGKKVASIGDDAFSSCSGLNSVTVLCSPTLIGIDPESDYPNIFRSCPNIKEVNFDCEKVTSLFNIRTSIENVTMGANVKSIEDQAFADFTSLTSITIPYGVISIGVGSFYNCRNLTSISLPNSLISIGGGAFQKCCSLTSVSIPNSVTSIGYMAFQSCSGLISVTIPNSVTSIGSESFAWCSGLTSVTIPYSVTSIGFGAFAYCPSLTSVTVDINTPLAITNNTFSNRANATLYVPVGSISAYKAADRWKDFKTIKDTEGRTEDASEPSGMDVTDISQLENAIYIEPTEGRVSEVVELPVQLKNTMSAVGCSFRLTLPEGFTLQKDGDGDVIYEMGDRAKKMSLTFNGSNNNRTYDFALTPSTGTATISGNDGVVVTFKVVIPETATEGAHALRLTNNLIQSRVDGATRDFPQSDITTVINVSNYVTGDVNSDGVVTPSDAIMILYHYFNVEQNGFNVKAADINGDGNISPADAIEALYIYFNVGSANTRSALVDDQLDLEPE